MDIFTSMSLQPHILSSFLVFFAPPVAAIHYKSHIPPLEVDCFTYYFINLAIGFRAFHYEQDMIIDTDVHTYHSYPQAPRIYVGSQEHLQATPALSRGVCLALNNDSILRVIQVRTS